MSKYAKLQYVVIKETPGYHIDSYSNTEEVDRFEDVHEAMLRRDQLLNEPVKGWDDCNYYVEVVYQ